MGAQQVLEQRQALARRACQVEGCICLVPGGLSEPHHPLLSGQVAAGLRVWTHPSKGTTDAVSGATDTAQAPELLPPSDAGAVLDAVAKMARLTKWGMRQAAWELGELSMEAGA